MQSSSADTTFLFTDIEGSTRLWEQEPERMSVAPKTYSAHGIESGHSRRTTASGRLRSDEVPDGAEIAEAVK